MGMGDRRKNSEISQNRISTEWMEAERGEEDASRVLASERARSPTGKLPNRPLARAALDVLLGNHWNFRGNRVI